MCGFGDDAVVLFDTNVPIAFSCGGGGGDEAFIKTLSHKQAPNILR